MRIWNFLIIYSCWSDGGLIEENDTAVDENLGEKKTVFLKDVLPKDEYKVRDPRTRAGRPHRAASTKSKIQGSHRTSLVPPGPKKPQKFRTNSRRGVRGPGGASIPV